MWNASQKTTFAKNIISRHFTGPALKYLSGPVREALVAEECFSIARGQMTETVAVTAMDDLLAGVRHEVEKRMYVGFFE